jgi:hypothetical protein
MPRDPIIKRIAAIVVNYIKKKIKKKTLRRDATTAHALRLSDANLVNESNETRRRSWRISRINGADAEEV